MSRVASDVFSDPQMGALALAHSKIALASFSRAQELEADGIGVGISARAGFDPYGAARFLTAMGRNAELRQTATAASIALLDFLSSHPATPDRIRTRAPMRASTPRPAPARATRTGYLGGIDGLVLWR